MQHRTAFDLDRAASFGAGLQIGFNAADRIGFFGATPVVQPSGAAQAQITSGAGTAGASTADVTATFTQTILNNNFATLVQRINAILTALVALGVIKGSA